MENLTPDTLKAFAAIGILALAGMAVLIIFGLYSWLKENVIFWYKKYKDKHRFDGPPKGKCYCVQCEYWHTDNPNRESGLCTIWEKWTADNELCYRGVVRDIQGYKDEKWRTNG